MGNGCLFIARIREEKKNKDPFDALSFQPIESPMSPQHSLLLQKQSQMSFLASQQFTLQRPNRIQNRLNALKSKYQHDIIFSKDEKGKLGIYSNYLVQLFEEAYADKRTLYNLISDNYQTVVEAPPPSQWEDEEFITPGSCLDDTLCAFLNKSSKHFSGFIVQEQMSNAPPDTKQQNFKVLCQDQENQQRLLGVQFYVSDCHNSIKDLLLTIHKSQTYKLLQNMLPVHFLEEIFEIGIGTKFQKEITRYCVLYELETPEHHKQITLEEALRATHNHMSLQSVSFVLLQLIELVLSLFQLGLYSYLNISPSSLVLNDMQRLALKSDLARTFRLQSIERPNRQQDQKLFVSLNLFKQQAKVFDPQNLIKDVSTPNLNKRLQVALIIQRLLAKVAPQYLTSQSALSTEQSSFRSFSGSPKKQKNTEQKLYRYLDNLLFQLKNPDEAEVNLSEMMRQSYEDLNSMEVFQSLILQFFEEKQYTAVTFVHSKLNDFQLLQGDENFENVFNILINSGRAYMKTIGKSAEAISVLKECHAFCLDKKGENNQEGAKALYWLAKAYYKNDQTKTSLDFNTKAFQLSVKVQGQYKLQTALCHQLFALCFREMKQHEKSLTHLEQELAIHLHLNQITQKTYPIAKNYQRQAKLYKTLDKHIQALYNFEKAQSIYTMLLGDTDSKSLACSKEIGLALVNTNQHRQALENFLSMLIIHQRMYAPFHLEIFHDQKQIGLCHLALKNYKEARFNLEKAYKIAEQILVHNDTNQNARFSQDTLEDTSTDQIEFISINFWLGLVYYEGYGDFNKASTYFKSALALLLEVSKQGPHQKLLAKLYYFNGLVSTKLEQWEDSRVHFQQALDFYQGQDIKDEQYYEVTIDIFRQLIDSLKELQEVGFACDVANQSIIYLKIAIKKASSAAKPNRELNLAKMQLLHAQLLSQIDQEEHAQKILELYLASLTIFERDARNNKSSVVDINVTVALLYQEKADFMKTIKHLQRAKDTHDKLQGGGLNSQQGHELTIMLAKANCLYGRKREALDYLKALKSNPLASDYLKSFSAHETCEMSKLLGELYEDISNFFAAATHYREAYDILKTYDIEGQEAQLPELVNALAFCYNQLGDFEYAILYTEELSAINAKTYGESHPHTVNSTISLLNLYSKIMIRTQEQSFHVESLKKKFVDTLLLDCSKYKEKGFEFDKWTEDEEFTLFQGYLLTKHAVGLLNRQFSQPPDQPTMFDFLLEEQQGKLQNLLDTLGNIGLKEARVQAKSKGKVKGKKKKSPKRKEGVMDERSI